MIINSSKIIDDLKILQPIKFEDERGYFIETYNSLKYRFNDENGNELFFLEDDISISKKNVIRGLHGDKKTWKLVQCLYGEIFFVIIDYRKNSNTFLKKEYFNLSDKNNLQLLIPAGCANGIQCLSEKSIFSYKQSEIYNVKNEQFTLKWDDPSLAIDWPNKNPILSKRDSNATLLNFKNNEQNEL